MTRKYYTMIALVIKTQLGQAMSSEPTKGVLSRFAHSLARELQKDNPRFNPEKFLIACGIEK